MCIHFRCPYLWHFQGSSPTPPPPTRTHTPIAAPLWLTKLQSKLFAGVCVCVCVCGRCDEKFVEQFVSSLCGTRMHRAVLISCPFTALTVLCSPAFHVAQIAICQSRKDESSKICLKRTPSYILRWPSTSFLYADMCFSL